MEIYIIYIIYIYLIYIHGPAEQVYAPHKYVNIHTYSYK